MPCWPAASALVVHSAGAPVTAPTAQPAMGGPPWRNASGPVNPAPAGMDWRLAAVLGAVVLIAGVAIAFYQLRIKRARLAMFRDGVA